MSSRYRVWFVPSDADTRWPYSVDRATAMPSHGSVANVRLTTV